MGDINIMGIIIKVFKWDKSLCNTKCRKILSDERKGRDCFWKGVGKEKSDQVK